MVDGSYDSDFGWRAWQFFPPFPLCCYMILGIGTDLLYVNKIRATIKRSGNSFLQNVFTDREMDYCNRQRKPFYHFAAFFAAKEAFIKSLGEGILSLDLKDIEVVRKKDGLVEIILYEKANEKTEKLGVNKIACSLSHSGKYAVASVVISS